MVSMAVKEVPSDHDFFDPGYVKQWTDSIVRYRPERLQLFKAFAAEAAGIQKDRLSVLELDAARVFWLNNCCKTAIYRVTRLSISRLTCWSLAGSV